MSQYPNSGTLGANKYKRDGDRQPDLKGKADITCPYCQKESAFLLSGWIKQGESGEFTSLRFEDKQSADRRKKHVQATQPQEKPASQPCNEDDVPF